MRDVVLREQMPNISHAMVLIADVDGDRAVDEFADSEAVRSAASARLGGRPVRWEPERMLWRVKEDDDG